MQESEGGSSGIVECGAAVLGCTLIAFRAGPDGVLGCASQGVRGSPESELGLVWSSIRGVGESDE